MVNGGGETGPMVRLISIPDGEVPAETLAIYSQAGAGAYREFERAGEVARKADAESAGRLLCAWNAFALQTIAEDLLAGSGSLMAGQVLAFFGQVGSWMARARRAAAEPGYRVEEELDLPAELPLRRRAEPCTVTWLRALASAVRKIRVPAESAAADRGETDRLAYWLVRGSKAAERADQLLAAEPVQAVHPVIEEQLHRALAAYYRLGQLAMLPALPDGRLDRALGAGGPLDLADIDVWYFTDQEIGQSWRTDQRSRRSVSALWEADPDPGTTVRIQTEINVALRAGYLGPAMDLSGRRLGPYFRCPWPAVHEVRRRVVIGDVPLGPMQQFTYEVGADGRSFARRIKVGTFIPTDQVDYCEPRATEATVRAFPMRRHG